MRARSLKRQRLMRVYAGLRRQFLEANPSCLRCGKPATEVHHAAGRRGLALTAVEDFRALCHGCHQWVTEHPAAAMEQGFSLSRMGGTA